MELEIIAQTSVRCIPFSLLFTQHTDPMHAGDQTGGAETETQTSLDGIVKTDSEEDEDVDR